MSEDILILYGIIALSALAVFVFYRKGSDIFISGTFNDYFIYIDKPLREWFRERENRMIFFRFKGIRNLLANLPYFVPTAVLCHIIIKLYDHFGFKPIDTDKFTRTFLSLAVFGLVYGLVYLAEKIYLKQRLIFFISVFFLPLALPNTTTLNWRVESIFLLSWSPMLAKHYALSLRNADSK